MSKLPIIPPVLSCYRAQSQRKTLKDDLFTFIKSNTTAVCSVCETNRRKKNLSVYEAQSVENCSSSIHESFIMYI